MLEEILQKKIEKNMMMKPVDDADEDENDGQIANWDD